MCEERVIFIQDGQKSDIKRGDEEVQHLTLKKNKNINHYIRKI